MGKLVIFCPNFYLDPHDILIHIIQIYSRITSGRVLDGELLYTEILEVNLFAQSVGKCQ